jgi:tetratricopeptide (TPR) repeat protein
MKKLIVLTCVLLTAAQAIYAQPKPTLHQKDLFRGRLDSKQRCTIIYASDGKTALAGNNEDYKSPFGTIWFLPAEKGKFGRVYFGWQAHGVHFPQGGMNDRGLFYDGASAENVTVPRDSSKPLYKGNLILKAMEECSTVEEVLKLFERYDVPLGNGQFLVGDRFGNSAIIEATGAIIRKKGTYQIVTNFFQSKTKPENITDTRYRMATEMLEQSENISVDLFRRILNAVHWEEYSGSMTVTLYSYICDLKKGEIYVYHFHNFEDAVRIKLQDELKKGERSQSIVSLFPYETFAAKRYKAQRTVGLLYERALEKGVDGAIALFNEIKRGDYNSYQLSVVEGHLIALGYELLENNNTKEAIEVFKYAVSEYPGSANAYDSLGEAYVKDGNRTQAIEYYKKALELNPDLETAKQALKTLGAIER